LNARTWKYRIIRKLKLKDPLRLRFTANKFGPYAEQLRHLLNALDGSYVHCEKRLSDAGPFDLIWFEDNKKRELESFLQTETREEYRDALDQATKVIDGFESPFGMELLSTVDWLINSGKAKPKIDSLKAAISEWPSNKSAVRRKVTLFNDRQLQTALHRLSELDLAA
jgi:hypothetical protein